MKNGGIKKFLLFTLINLVVITAVVALLSERPRVTKINSVELRSKTGDSLQVAVNITVENPNFYSISGHDVVIKSLSGETVLGEGHIDKFSLDGHASDIITVIITMNSDALLKTYEASKDNFQNTLSISGSFWPLFFVSEIEVQPQLSESSMSQLLVESFFADNDISFDSLNYTPVSAVESKMNFNVSLRNSFGFNFTVQEMDVEVLPMEGSPTVLGNWKLTREIEMQPGQPIVLPGSLTVHHMALMLAGLEKGGKDLNTAWVTGTVTVKTDKEPFSIPFGFPVTADMSKLKINKKEQ